MRRRFNLGKIGAIRILREVWADSSEEKAAVAELLPPKSRV